MQDLNAVSNGIIGAYTWAMASGLLSSTGNDDRARPDGEDAICLLNAGGAHADVEVTILFGDRDPAGPYKVVAPALRLLHLRFDELEGPEPIPRDTPFAAVIESDEPIVVQPAVPQPASWVRFLSELPHTQSFQ